jgi:poly(3-hydroxybutyrate) depolymerase
VNLGGANLGNVLSSEDTAKYWAKLLGVTAQPQSATLPHKGGRTSVDSMTWVKDGTPVVILYSVQNGGARHAARRRGLGFARRDLGFLLQIAEPLTSRDGSTGITPLHHYYGAVRPSPAHRYFWPRS